MKIFDGFLAEPIIDEKRNSLEEISDIGIQWILKQVKGNKVLNIGLKQHDAAIRIGRKGKRVLGIDTSDKFVNRAKDILKGESPSIKRNVEFRNIDFLTFNVWNEKYDTVIINDVVGGVNFLKKYVNKAVGLLRGKGKVIINFSLSSTQVEMMKLADLLSLATGSLKLTTIEINRNQAWIALEQNADFKTIKLYEDLLKRFEDSHLESEDVRSAPSEDSIIFLENHSSTVKRHQDGSDNSRKTDVDKVDLRESVELLKSQQSKVSDISKEIYESNVLLRKFGQEMSGLNSLVEQNRENQKQINELNNKLSLYKLEVEKMKKQLVEEKRAKIKVLEEVNSMYEKEEKLLKSHRKLIMKYQALSNSKLGKLTIAYWRFVKQFKRGKK
ncbi:methyltransferase domain-containing protein [Mesobacillus maritimus]|uniref:class I SAM-dependent methyltransferase n=1 Tax=Mesobacillus maritimus TaxID=1643336 RepID=UPI00384C6E66